MPRQLFDQFTSSTRSSRGSGSSRAPAASSLLAAQHRPGQLAHRPEERGHRGRRGARDDPHLRQGGRPQIVNDLKTIAKVPGASARTTSRRPARPAQRHDQVGAHRRLHGRERQAAPAAGRELDLKPPPAGSPGAPDSLSAPLPAQRSPTSTSRRRSRRRRTPSRCRDLLQQFGALGIPLGGSALSGGARGGPGSPAAVRRLDVGADPARPPRRTSSASRRQRQGARRRSTRARAAPRSVAGRRNRLARGPEPASAAVARSCSGSGQLAVPALAADPGRGRRSTSRRPGDGRLLRLGARADPARRR